MPPAVSSPTPTRLNQILSIEKNAKMAFEVDLNAFYFQAKKPDVFYGHVKTHSPKGQDDEKKPTDIKHVQVNTREVLTRLETEFSKFFDLLAQKEATSCDAKADILIDGAAWEKDVPVMTLISMEKQLSGQIIPLLNQLPVLSADEKWKWNSAQALFTTDPKETFSKRLAKRPLQMAKATDKHAEQVQLIEEEIVTGTWSNVSFSSAYEKVEVDKWKGQAQILLEAVKFARQNAAQTPVRGQKLGTKMMEFIFG